MGTRLLAVFLRLEPIQRDRGKRATVERDLVEERLEPALPHLEVSVQVDHHLPPRQPAPPRPAPADPQRLGALMVDQPHQLTKHPRHVVLQVRPVPVWKRSLYSVS
jgi:hypothetical protein